MKKWVLLCLGFTFAISMLSGCSGDSSSQPSSTTDVNASTEQPEKEKVVIADDEYVTATFEKIYDATSMGVEGVFYVDLNVKNKTDKEIWIYLDNASVNDEMVPLVGSGVPFYILPEKSGRNGFIFSFASLSIDSIDDVKTISFDMVVADEESLEEIERVEAIKLDF